MNTKESKFDPTGWERGPIEANGALMWSENQEWPEVSLYHGTGEDPTWSAAQDGCWMGGTYATHEEALAMCESRTELEKGFDQDRWDGAQKIAEDGENLEVIYLVAEIKRMQTKMATIAVEMTKIRDGLLTLEKMPPAFKFTSCVCGLPPGYHAEGCPSYPGWADPGGSGKAPKPIGLKVGGVSELSLPEYYCVRRQGYFDHGKPCGVCTNHPICEAEVPEHTLKVGDEILTYIGPPERAVIHVLTVYELEEYFFWAVDNTTEERWHISWDATWVKAGEVLPPLSESMNALYPLRVQANRKEENG